MAGRGRGPCVAEEGGRGGYSAAVAGDLSCNSLDFYGAMGDGRRGRGEERKGGRKEGERGL